MASALLCWSNVMDRLYAPTSVAADVSHAARQAGVAVAAHGPAGAESPDSHLPRGKPSCPCGGHCPRCAAGKSAQASPPERTASAPSPAVSEILRSHGQPLEPAVRDFMESRFGRDL